MDACKTTKKVAVQGWDNGGNSDLVNQNLHQTTRSLLQEAVTLGGGRLADCLTKACRRRSHGTSCKSLLGCAFEALALLGQDQAVLVEDPTGGRHDQV